MRAGAPASATDDADSLPSFYGIPGPYKDFTGMRVERFYAATVINDYVQTIAPRFAVGSFYATVVRSVNGRRVGAIDVQTGMSKFVVLINFVAGSRPEQARARISATGWRSVQNA